MHDKMHKMLTVTPISIFLVNYVGHWKQPYQKKFYTKARLNEFVRSLNEQGFYYQIIEIPTPLELITADPMPQG